MSQYLDWKVGDRVVCVTPLDPTPCAEPEPDEGEICTIARIFETPDNEISIELVEYPVVEDEDNWAGWNPIHFRKVQPRKTDISIFTQMLNPSKQRERA